MADQFDQNDDNSPVDGNKSLNAKKIPARKSAVALRGDIDSDNQIPHIAAAGRGKIAEQILELAFDNDIKVREDSALVEMLTAIELDSPIPSEAYLAVAEILSYVYQANGEPNPFDAIFKDAMKEQIEKGESDQ